jgi:multidrug resistance protein, MATE family
MAEDQSISNRILKLALPFLAANISVPLLGLVDTAVLGHLESEKYLGAIALGGMVFSFLFWGFGFLKMGTTGFTSQACGEQNAVKISLVLSRGVVVALALGVFFIVFRNQIWYVSSFFIEGSDQVVELAYEYFSVRIFSAPAVFLLYVIQGWFLGMQNAMYVLWVAIVENVSNILFNLLFIYVFDMRADGVALGTVCAQYLALSLAIVLLMYRYRKTLRVHLLSDVFKANELLHYLKVNGDIMIRTLALMFAFAFFTVKSSSYNDVLLASNMILMQLLIFFAYVVDGLAHAGETLAGFYFGAGKKYMLKTLLKKLFIWSSLLAVVFSIFYAVFFKQILLLLTNQQGVIESAMHYKYWLVALPILSFAAFIFDGIFIGLTLSARLRNAMLMSLLIVYLPVYYLSSQLLENHALWFAFSLFMMARGAFLWLFWVKRD